MAGRSRGILFAALLAMMALTAQYAFAQTTYSITVSTAMPSYAQGDHIQITGKVSPPPGPSTAVFLEITNPKGHTVSVGDAPVDAATGNYDFTVTAGGSGAWIVGTYTVNATWGAYSPQIYALASFSYGIPVTSTTSTTPTTSTTSVVTSSNTSSSTTSSSMTSTTTTTSKPGGGIPEFPPEAILAFVFSAVVVFAYLAMRRSAPRNRQSLRT